MPTCRPLLLRPQRWLTTLTRACAPPSRAVAAQQAAIERETELLLRRKEAARTLELELARREAILTEKEALVEAKEQLQARRAPRIPAPPPVADPRSICGRCS